MSYFSIPLKVITFSPCASEDSLIVNVFMSKVDAMFFKALGQADAWESGNLTRLSWLRSGSKGASMSRA